MSNRLVITDRRTMQVGANSQSVLLVGSRQSLTPHTETLENLLRRNRREIIKLINEDLARIHGKFVDASSKEITESWGNEALLCSNLLVEGANLFKSGYMNDEAIRRAIVIWQHEVVGKDLSTVNLELQFEDDALEARMKRILETSNPSSAALPLARQLSSIFDSVSVAVKALAWLVVTGFTVLPYRRHRQARESLRQGELAFIEYIAHARVSGGDLEGEFFRQIPRDVGAQEMSTRRVFMFAPSRMASSYSKAFKMVRRSRDQDMMAYEFLNPSDFLKAGHAVFRNALQLGLSKKNRQFIPSNGLEAVAVAQLKRSYFGTIATRHLLDWISFERLIGSKDLRRRAVCYAAENQGWEHILNMICRRAQVKTSAYFHSVAKPWDMRGSWLSQTSETRFSFSLPHLVLANSGSDELLLREKFSDVKIIQVEALRYQQAGSYKSKVHARREETSRLKVLGLAGYSLDRALRLSNALRVAEGVESKRMTCHFLPHPTHFKASFPSEVVARKPGVSLAVMLRDYDVAVVDGETSAAIDAKMAGLPIIVFADPLELPTSPAGETAAFCYKEEELAQVIRETVATPGTPDHTSLPIQRGPGLAYERWLSALRLLGVHSLKT